MIGDGCRRVRRLNKAKARTLTANAPTTRGELHPQSLPWTKPSTSPPTARTSSRAPARSGSGVLRLCRTSGT